MYISSEGLIIWWVNYIILHYFYSFLISPREKLLVSPMKVYDLYHTSLNYFKTICLYYLWSPAKNKGNRVVKSVIKVQLLDLDSHIKKIV